jgi:hypothetical protein
MPGILRGIARTAVVRDTGVLTDAEFELGKRKILG